MIVSPLQTVSEAGRAGRPNEDGVGTAGRFAWIIDGATGLGEPLLDAPSDAAWLTAVLHRTLSEGAAAAPDAPALLAQAAHEAERRFRAERTRPPAERYEIPTAAVLLAGVANGAVEIVELGDCAVYIESDGALARYGGTEEGRALERANARRTMAGGSGRTAEVLELLRAVRNKANTAEGYAIFAPEAGCIARARRHVHRAGRGEALFLTDGFEAAIEDYGLYTPRSLFAAARTDLAAPLATLREVERGDPRCVRFPRFKPSDDATAMLVRFAPSA